MDLVLKGKTSKLKGFNAHPESTTEGVLSFNDQFDVIIPKIKINIIYIKNGLCRFFYYS
jgi:hypothetical protein